MENSSDGRTRQRWSLSGIIERRIVEGVRRKMLEIESGRDNVGGVENEISFL